MSLEEVRGIGRIDRIRLGYGGRREVAHIWLLSRHGIAEAVDSLRIHWTPLLGQRIGIGRHMLRQPVVEAGIEQVREQPADADSRHYWALLSLFRVSKKPVLL